MPYNVYKTYNNTYDRRVDSYEALIEFIQRKATKWNFGVYRHWEQDGVLYFDVGPTVYAAYATLTEGVDVTNHEAN